MDAKGEFIEEPSAVADGILRTLEACGDPVFVVDDHWSIVSWNKAAESAFHRRADDVQGHPCYEVIAGADDSGRQVCRLHCEKWALARRGAPIHNFDIQALGDHGVWANVSILPISDAAGRPLALAHVLRNVNRAKRLERFLQELATDAEDVLAARATNGVTERAPARLTLREAEVLGLLAHGAGTQVIADRLGVSTHTVHNHIAVILNKLGVHSRAGAVAYAFEHHLA
ncbi:MAG: PAS domain-containing protein [Chloroflexi bacterium]|nr:PAS domain-containing protein [Chloroflexota bacterium]